MTPRGARARARVAARGGNGRGDGGGLPARAHPTRPNHASDLRDHCSDRVVANATVDAAISVAANETSFANQLAERGITTVVMDEDGRLVRHHPDGSTTAL